MEPTQNLLKEKTLVVLETLNLFYSNELDP